MTNNVLTSGPRKAEIYPYIIGEIFALCKPVQVCQFD